MLSLHHFMSLLTIVSFMHVCVLGERLKSSRHGHSAYQKTHSDATGEGALKFCDTDVGGIVLQPVRGLDDAIHNSWHLPQAGPNSSTNVHGNKASQPIKQSLQVTHDGIVVQLAADAYSDRGPECVRISSSPKCADEGQIFEMGDEANRFRMKTTYMPLRHQAILASDKAIGDWTSSVLTFSITPTLQTKGLPKLTITQKNEDDTADHGEVEEWYGELSDPDSGGIRSVVLANPYDGNRNFTLQQVTGNSMKVWFGGKTGESQVAMRDYDAKNLTVTAFVCGRSTTASDWVALRGYTWIFESPANRGVDFENKLTGLYGPKWKVEEYSNNHHSGSAGSAASWRSRSERHLRWSTLQEAPALSQEFLKSMAVGPHNIASLVVMVVYVLGFCHQWQE